MKKAVNDNCISYKLTINGTSMKLKLNNSCGGGLVKKHG